MTVMDKAGDASLIHDHLSRHAAQLEQFNFLSEAFQDTGLWVRQADKRKIVMRQ